MPTATTVPRFIQLRQLAHFHRADAEYGRRVAEGLDIDLADVLQHTVA